MSPDCIKLLFVILYKIIAHLFSTFIYILSYTLFIYRYRTRLTNFANKYVKTSLKQKMLEAIAGIMSDYLTYLFEDLMCMSEYLKRM